MKVEIKDKKLTAVTDLPARQVICPIYERQNVTGFSDIDYKPLPIVASIEQNNINPNCGIVISENGNLLLITSLPVAAGDRLTANFVSSRYLKNKKKDKPNMDNPTLDRMTNADYLNMHRMNDWGIQKR